MNRVAGTYLLCTLSALGAYDACAQERQTVPATQACVEFNQRVVVLVRNGQVTAADAAIRDALASGADRAQTYCAGFVLNNMAALVSVSGRFAQAEAFAERSFAVLEKVLPADDPLLLRPLQILASTRFEQRKLTKAREAFERMQKIRAETPQDTALVHGMGAALLQAEGKLGEAEAEDLAALYAWEKAGLGETADAASILTALGSLYIDEHRLDDAARVLARTLDVLNHAPDVIPMDRIRLFLLRGVLRAKQGEWRKSEEDFSLALSMADQEAKVNGAVLRPLLTSYAIVLRKNHRRHEARAIESRAAALGRDYIAEDVVDVNGLLSERDGVKKK